MDQSRAVNALAPFLALAKSANSPRAAADLITQATTAPNTYIFAELLQQPNVQSLSGHEQYGNHLTLLQCFAWGTWETYNNTPDLPSLSDAQALKLRLLSLLSIASEKHTSDSQASNLSYASLCHRLDLPSPIDLEHLITTAIYRNLLTATLNPATQTVIITSVAPLRDLAPGRVTTLVADLDTWRARCDGVLADLDAEIKKVHSDAEKRAKREAGAEKQIKSATETADKGQVMKGQALGGLRSGGNARPGHMKRESVDSDDGDDPMDLDGAALSNGSVAKKRGGGAAVTDGPLSRYTKGNSR